jgi:alanyl-tRNA synthetase
VDAAQLARVEAICRDWVAAAKPVTSKEVPLSQAKAIKGLRAVFGEVRDVICVVLCYGGLLYVTSKEVPLSQAKAIKGLRAVFGEVRGDIYV